MKGHFRIVVLLLTVSVFLSFSACQKGGEKPFGVTDIEIPGLEMSGWDHLPEETTLTDGEVMVTPLSEKMEKQIIADYQKYQKKNGGYDVEYYISRYYGCYNGAIPVVIRGRDLMYLDVIERVEVADCIFHFSDSGMEIDVWYCGTFWTLKEAYDTGLLSEKQIRMIHKIHGNWIENSPELENARNVYIDLNQEKRKEIREAFGWEADEKWWFEVGMAKVLTYEAIRCYANVDDTLILMIPSSEGDATTIKIKDSVFEYPYEFELWVYREGERLTLEKAFNSGIVSKELIARAAICHQVLQTFTEKEEVRY